MMAAPAIVIPPLRDVPAGSGPPDQLTEEHTVLLAGVSLKLFSTLHFETRERIQVFSMTDLTKCHLRLENLDDSDEAVAAEISAVESYHEIVNEFNGSCLTRVENCSKDGYLPMFHFDREDEETPYGRTAACAELLVLLPGTSGKTGRRAAATAILAAIGGSEKDLDAASELPRVQKYLAIHNKQSPWRLYDEPASKRARLHDN